MTDQVTLFSLEEVSFILIQDDREKLCLSKLECSYQESQTSIYEHYFLLQVMGMVVVVYTLYHQRLTSVIITNVECVTTPPVVIINYNYTLQNMEVSKPHQFFCGPVSAALFVRRGKNAHAGKKFFFQFKIPVTIY